MLALTDFNLAAKVPALPFPAVNRVGIVPGGALTAAQVSQLQRPGVSALDTEWCNADNAASYSLSIVTAIRAAQAQVYRQLGVTLVQYGLIGAHNWSPTSAQDYPPAVSMAHQAIADGAFSLLDGLGIDGYQIFSPATVPGAVYVWHSYLNGNIDVAALAGKPLYCWISPWYAGGAWGYQPASLQPLLDWTCQCQCIRRLISAGKIATAILYDPCPMWDGTASAHHAAFESIFSK